MYVSNPWGKNVYEKIPGARRFELIAFCGHFWLEERPEALTALVGEFLREYTAL